MSIGDGFSGLTVALWTLLFAVLMVAIGWLDRQGRNGRIASRVLLIAGGAVIAIYMLTTSSNLLAAMPFAAGSVGVFALIAWGFCGLGMAIADARAGTPNAVSPTARSLGALFAFATSFLIAVFIAFAVDCYTADYCD